MWRIISSGPPIKKRHFSDNSDIPDKPSAKAAHDCFTNHTIGRNKMIADQSHRDCRERMETNPVSITLMPSLKNGMLTALVTGVLLCIQAFPANAASGIHKEANMANGIIHSKVPGDVDSVWDKLLSTLENMKAPVFSKVDHKANAVSVGLDMKQARVVAFGNPAVGTFLMQENPEAALDLPLKILVWESPDGTMLSWNDPEWIARRYGIDPDNETVKKMRKMFGIISEKMHEPH